MLIQTAEHATDVLGAALAVVALVSFGVGAWVVLREGARRVSVTLLAGSTAIAVYLMGFSFMVRSSSPMEAFLWAEVAYLGVPFIVPALFQFSMEVLGRWHERQRWITAAWVVGVVYVVLAVGTDLLLDGVERAAWGYYTDLTLWNVVFVGWSVVLVGLTVHEFWRAHRRATGVQRARIRWLAIPMVVASVGFIDYGPSFGLNLPPVGFVFLTAFPLAAAWVVARYHLPDLTPAFAADQIVATMAEPLLVVDQPGRIAFANPAASRLLGWSEEELEDRMLASVVGADLAGELLESTGGHGRELELEARSGEPIAVSATTSDLMVKGRPVGTVIVARDIRERKRAARQLARREQHFRALIEHARDTITVLDADGRVRYRSPSHEEILGVTPDGSIGASVFSRVHPDDTERVLRELGTLVAEPGGIARSEVRMQHANGGYRIMDLRARNLLDHPAVRGIVINGRDVTEERELAERLQQSQKMEAVGRLAGGIAHDFNNILTTIQGAVALLAEEVDEESGLDDELEVIRDGAARAGRLTSQLLAFSRRQVTRPETLSTDQLIQDLASGLRQLLKEHQRLVIHPSEGVGSIRVDRGQIEQVLVNLVVNARDAMGARGRVEIVTENVRVGRKQSEDLPIEPGAYVRISVVDDGHGMDAETAQRIFEPFFSTKDASVGDGLGLASVYGAVRQAGGYVEVESRPGEGARFSLYLPRVEPERPGRVAAGTGTGGNGETVLVVEDEEPVRHLITRILEREGYAVLTAPDGETALRVAADHPGSIDLLVADLVMPGMSGREVAERLTAAHPALETILISGYTADEVVREGINRGEYEFLPKPFDPPTLVSRVSAVLARTPLPG
ncbi:MAG: PAS domain S-box protein [Longimicrobiales bacterium]|nr:PAS domain S-box protein [Longimicrobiales bacterium]